MFRFLLCCIFVFLLIRGKAQMLIFNFLPDSANVAIELLNPGFLVRNVEYKGNALSIGKFVSQEGILPFSNGLVLSTGLAKYIASPNYSGSMSYDMGSNGDLDLSKLAMMNTIDAASLQFDFLAYSDSICFEYFFGSEEYPEYVDKGVNDVFTFFITNLETGEKQNLAIVNHKPVAVDNINQNTNSRYFIANKPWNFETMEYFRRFPEEVKLSETIEFDGITVKLTAACKVKPFEWYRLKLAIADAGDAVYDSGVFIRSRSLRNVGRIPDYALEMSIKAFIGENRNITSIIEHNQLIVRANIQFEADSFLVEKNFTGYLDLLAELMKLNGSFTVEVSGHTDNSGNDAYNLELSIRRAEQVTEYLIKKGVPENRLIFRGYGQSKPLVPNTTPENKAINRRVEFRFLK